MSVPYSDTTKKNGLLQICEKNCLLGDGSITGNALLKAQFTGDINLGVDKVFSLIFQVGGTWQFDDSNQTDYPIITTNLVAGQRDYSFTADSSGNLIHDIYRVLVAGQNGLFYEIQPVDVSSGRAPMSYVSGQNVGGQPNSYDKLANGIFLDPIPNYNSTGGLKVYVNREGSYFVTTDTTKKAGFAGLFHEYPALYASYKYARTNSLSNKNDLYAEMTQMEQAIMDYYKSRERDVQKQFIGIRHSSR